MSGTTEKEEGHFFFISLQSSVLLAALYEKKGAKREKEGCKRKKREKKERDHITTSRVLRFTEVEINTTLNSRQLVFCKRYQSRRAARGTVVPFCVL